MAVGPGNAAAAIAAQIEFIRPELENLVLDSSVFWKRLTQRTDVKPVSGRPSRIPFMTAGAAAFRTFNPDGGAMGTGIGPQEAPGYLSTFAYLQASEYTAQAVWTTDSDEKAIQNYVTLTQDQASKSVAGALDSLAANSDGSNTLDSVVSAGATSIVVNNPNAFQDGQTIAVWSALGGTFRGNATINSVNALTSTLQLTGAPPVGTTGGDLLLIQGSSGVANTGIAGIPAYNVAGDTGNYMGISKAAWSGKFSTPNIDLGNAALTPAIVRAISLKQVLAMGNDNDGASQVAHCNVDMVAAWENNAIEMQSIVLNQVGGDQITDSLKKKAPTMIAGRQILLNVRAIPARIDFLDLSYWFRLQTKALDMYEVGGQTLFPAYDGAGGLAASMLFYYVIEANMGNGQPRRSAFLSNVAQPPNIFA